MLAIPGKNPAGNVLHLVIGPESELVMDMQGATIMDVTQVINKFETAHPVYVSLSRSRSEIQTSNQLKSLGVPHMGITPNVEKCDGNCDSCKVDTDGNPVPNSLTAFTDKPASKARPKAKDEPCAYCRKVCQLLPIPGFKICQACAQIELGLNKANKNTAVKDSHAQGNKT